MFEGACAGRVAQREVVRCCRRDTFYSLFLTTGDFLLHIGHTCVCASSILSFSLGFGFRHEFVWEGGREGVG